ncbi:MAG: hypothetical protein Tsb0020_04790 [Haliangiales bacterium]
MDRRMDTAPRAATQHGSTGTSGARAGSGHDTRDSFCDYLVSARRQRSMSVIQIAEVTRIPVRSLKRLEAGDFEKLPADVFVRGFIRSYARCVGLDVDESIRRYTRCGMTPAPVASPMADELASSLATLDEGHSASVRQVRRSEVAAVASGPVRTEPEAEPAGRAASQRAATAAGGEPDVTTEPSAQAAADRDGAKPTAVAAERASAAAAADKPEVGGASAAERAPDSRDGDSGVQSAATAASDTTADAGEPGAAGTRAKTRAGTEGAGNGTRRRRRRRRRRDAARRRNKAACAEPTPASASAGDAEPASEGAANGVSPGDASGASADEVQGDQARDVRAERAARGSTSSVGDAERSAAASDDAQAQTRAGDSDDAELAAEDAGVGHAVRGDEPSGRAAALARDASPAVRAIPVLVIDDDNPEVAELAQRERAAQAEASRNLLPQSLLDGDEGSHRGTLTLAVIILVIVATLTMSYLLRRPMASGDGVTQRTPTSWGNSGDAAGLTGVAFGAQVVETQASRGESAGLAPSTL